uniref:F-box domain-containing protein n=1 Tax=Glossina austeni TaxID=7395 RepID=A0A1A9VI26_GLOAU
MEKRRKIEQDVKDTLPDTQCDKNTKAPRFPNEIWAKIFNNLSHGDLLQVKLVCKEWYQVACMPQLKSKSKLVITRQNVKDICDFLDCNDLKYENVLVLDKDWDKTSNVQYAYLFKIFKSLASDVVRLTLYQSETLLALNNVLPNLRKLDIEKMIIDDGVSVDFTKFPNLKSILMPQICEDYLMRLAQPPRLGLEKLSLSLTYLSADCLDVLSMCASSLRWLTIRTILPIVSTDRARLQETFTKFTQLEMLDINSLQGTNDRRLILEALPKENYLKTLRLMLDENLLELIVRKWPDSLECLELNCDNGLTRSDVERLNFMSGKLRRLYLCGDEIQQGDLLHSIAPKTNKILNELRLRAVYLAEPFFHVLVERLPNLTCLELFECDPEITDENLGCIFHYLTQLRILYVGPCSGMLPIPYLSSKPNISNLKHLQTLRSCFCPINVLQDLRLEFEFKELNRIELRQFAEKSAEYKPLKDQDRIFTNLHGRHDWRLNSAMCRGDWYKINEIIKKGRGWILNEMRKAELGDRAKRSFPICKKLKNMKDKPTPTYLVINGAEGEPGTCKDREIMRHEPHKIIEGALILSYIIRARVAILYIRGRYYNEACTMQMAINEACAAGLLGKGAAGTCFNFDMVIQRGGGRYIVGEETALIRCLEGEEGLPRRKPPYPADCGLYKRPTLVFNAATVAAIPTIIRRGGDWYSSLGKDNDNNVRGSRVFCVSGHVTRPCIVEELNAVPLRYLINRHAGGVIGGWNNLLAVVPGGASTSLVPGRLCNNLNLDAESLRKVNSSEGTGAVIVIKKGTNILKAMLPIMKFYRKESCLQCPECRNASRWYEEYLTKFIEAIQLIATLGSVAKSAGKDRKAKISRANCHRVLTPNEEAGDKNYRPPPTLLPIVLG